MKSSDYNADYGSHYVGIESEMLRKQMFSGIMRKCIEHLFEKNGCDESNIISSESFSIIYDPKSCKKLLICDKETIGDRLQDLDDEIDYAIYLDNSKIMIDSISYENGHLRITNSESLLDTNFTILRTIEIRALEQYLLDIAEQYI